MSMSASQVKILRLAGGEKTTNADNNPKKIYEEIKVIAEQVDEKECPWSNGEYRPHWKITLIYRGHKRTFDFWNNTENKKPTKAELLDCLVGDAVLYIESNGDIDEIAKTLGIQSIKEASRVYNGCRKTYKKLSTLLCVSNDTLIEIANIAAHGLVS